MNILVDNVYIAMGRDRRDRKHEWLLCRHGIVKKAISFGSNDIRGVLALVGYGRVMVSLECCVTIFVREWIEQEVRPGKACSVWLVVVRDFLGVEELADVVGVVPG